MAALPVLEDGQKRAGKLGTAAQLLQISRQAQVRLSATNFFAKHAISKLIVEARHWRNTPMPSLPHCNKGAILQRSMHACTWHSV